MTLGAIAKFLDKSTTHVARRIKDIVENSRRSEQSQPAPGRKSSFFLRYVVDNKDHFSPEQVEYITCAETLTRWASKSLEERVSLLRRRYPNSKISLYKLRKLYAQHKIKKKVLRIEKIPRHASLMDVALQAADLRQDV